MGPLQNIIGMLPGMPKELKNAEIDDRELGTDRGDHPLDDPGRAHEPDASSTARAGCASPRAAASTTQDVNALLKQFKEMQQMMKRHDGRGQEASGPRFPVPAPGRCPGHGSRAS